MINLTIKNKGVKDNDNKKSRTPLHLKDFLLLGSLILLCLMALFVFISAINAYDVLIGTSVWGIGRLIFEESVANGSFKAVVGAKIGSVVVICLTIVIEIVYIVKKKK